MGSVASQCVGEIKTPALASWDGGRDVVMPPQPIQADESKKRARTLASHSKQEVPQGAQLFLLPVRDVICGRCGRALSTIGSTMKHFAVVHTEVQVLFGCRGCGKSSENSHSISCHIPKCKGVVETRMESEDDHMWALSIKIHYGYGTDPAHATQTHRHLPYGKGSGADSGQ